MQLLESDVTTTSTAPPSSRTIVYAPEILVSMSESRLVHSIVVVKTSNRNRNFGLL
jgi:hypothetical protein